ncbi:MAG: hypothetical protein ACYCST_20640 [Acidimicrobiales bacterium]
MTYISSSIAAGAALAFAIYEHDQALVLPAPSLPLAGTPGAPSCDGSVRGRRARR